MIAALWCMRLFIKCIKTILSSWFRVSFSLRFMEIILMLLAYKLKVGILHSKKKMFYFLQWKPFKSDENCFLFRLENYFRSQDIYVFVLTFWLCRKDSLIRSCLGLWCNNLVNKQLYYTYWPISHEVKTTRKWSLVG